MNRKKTARSLCSDKILYCGAAALLILAFLFSVSAGSVSIPLQDTVRILLGGIGIGDISGIPLQYGVIVGQIRLPRVLLSALVGAALSVSGTAMQGLLRNPLADSSTLGVSSCASLGAVFALWTGLEIPGFSFLGVAAVSVVFAFAAFLLILSLSYRIDRNLSTNTIILTGVVVSMFSGAVISFIISVAGERMPSIVFWTMGSFSGRGWDYVALVLPGAALGAAGLLRYAGELNAFALGEENAGYLGVDTKKVKIRILIFVSVAVGVSVSVSGTIAFVGLIIPHIARMLIGSNHKKLMPLSMMIGAAFLTATDLVSRTVIQPAELPVGAVTSLIGSVIFLYIFYTQKRGRP